ncbi:MAG: F0F1 ATP synthase subunit epsilon [Candidatus Dormibacteria bacterium]
MAATFEVRVVTAEAEIHASEATFLFVNGGEGELGIMAHHAPLLTTLRPGPVRIDHPDADSEILFVSGGFMEVLPERVTILADTAERAGDIDEARAEEARHRAEATLREHVTAEQSAAATAALERAIARIKVAELRRRRPHRPE